MDIPLNAKEDEYLAEEVRSGRAASEGEVLPDALQLLMERDAGGDEESDAWRPEIHWNIETGYREMLAGDTVDGEEFMEQLRIESEARRAGGS